MLLAKGIHFLLSRLGSFGLVLLLAGLLLLDDSGLSCNMMARSGAGGDDHPSSSFFEGISDWVPNPAEPGEERNSQPSQGVGQRLPGSLEISSPGISGESLFRDLEQPRREPAPQAEASSSAPAQGQQQQEEGGPFQATQPAPFSAPPEPAVAPEAQPQAPAPAEVAQREELQISIYQKRKQLFPNDPWDYDDPRIRGEKIFAGGKGKKHTSDDLRGVEIHSRQRKSEGERVLLD